MTMTPRLSFNRGLPGPVIHAGPAQRSAPGPRPAGDDLTALLPPRPDPFPRRHARADESIRPRRILVAEDEHLVALSLTLSLTDAGYTIIGPAADGEQAVQLARRLLPDLALLDIRMPRMNGIEAAQEIFGGLGIPVVIVSAHADEPLANAAAAAGVFGYVVKPASTEQLRAALTVAWGRFCEYAESEQVTEDLRRRIDERRTIEQAKWALVEVFGLTEPQALEEIRSRARDSRRTMIDIAIDILGQRK